MNTQPQTLFVVTHVTISASEPDANGFVDARLFKTKKQALDQLKTWRDEEMEYRKNTGAAYVVYTDTDQKFHCTWDSDCHHLYQRNRGGVIPHLLLTIVQI